MIEKPWSLRVARRTDRPLLIEYAGASVIASVEPCR
jgi:hypothetical protein